MIIDSHTHTGNVSGTVYTPEQLIQSMDEAGIEYSCIIAGKVTSDPHAHSTEETVTIAQKYSRLKAIGNVDYDTLDTQQIERLTTLLKEEKIVGVKFYPGYQNFYPDDKKMYPLYEYCQANKKPVIFHTGMLAIGYPGLLKQSHPLNIDDLANVFPDLRIVIAHVGNPWIIDCGAVMYKNKNVYADFSALAPEFQSISPADSADVIKQLTNLRTFLGNFNKCLFGTDWPLYSQREYVSITQQLPLAEEEKRLVFSQNAKEIFNLKI